MSTLADLKNEILTELTAQLSNDVGYSSTVVSSKLNVAFQEVLQARTQKYHGSYPSGMTDDEKYADLSQFSSHIFNLALFDYNTIGIEFQTSSTENSVTRTYRDRDRLFNGIVPLSRIV